MDQITDATCPQCHQPVLPNYYFCPNCGYSLKRAPLSVTPAAQAKIYAHSIILPIIAFITITKWQGVQYLKSDDKKAREVGLIASTLLALSSVFVVWYVIRLTNSITQASLDGINADLEGY